MIPQRRLVSGLGVGWLCLAVLAGCGKASPSRSGSAPTAVESANAALAAALAGDPTFTLFMPRDDLDQPMTMGAVAYSVPMVALSAVDQPQSPTLVQLDPPAPLALRWVGTTTLGFWPQEPLRGATEYRVQVAAQTSVDGKRVSPLSYSFRTPRPQLLRSYPADGTRDVSPDSPVVLEFNQPVELSTLATLSHFEGGDVPPIAVQCRPLDPVLMASLAKEREQELAAQDVARFVVVQPVRKLPPEARMSLLVAPGVRAVEGPLPSTQPIHLHFQTLGPLTVVSAGCGDACRSERWTNVTFEFNNDLNFDAASRFRHLVSLSPPVRGVDLSCYSSTCSLHAPYTADAKALFRPGQTYTLTIQPGWVDRFGQRLGTAKSFTFTIERPSPRLELSAHMSDSNGVIERDMGPHRVNLGAMGVTNLRGRYKRLQPKDVVAVLDLRTHLSNPNDLSQPPPSIVALPPLTMDGDLHLHQRLDAKGRPETFWSQSVLLDRLLNPTGAPTAATTGAVLLAVDASAVVAPSLPAKTGQPGGAAAAAQPLAARPVQPAQPVHMQDASIYQITDLHLFVKSGPSSSLIWVTSYSTGKPQVGADVRVLDGRGEEVWRGKTNADGLVAGPPALHAGGPSAYWDSPPEHEKPQPKDRRYVLAQVGTDWTLLAPQLTQIEAGASRVACVHRLGLFTDRDLYRMGDTVHVKGLLRDVGPQGIALPAAGQKVRLQLRPPAGQQLPVIEVAVSAAGSFDADIPIGTGHGYGTYSVEAQYGPCRTSGDFKVAVFRTPKFRLDATPATPRIVAGEPMHIDVAASYYSGGPLAQAKVTAKFSATSDAFHPAGWPAFRFSERDYSDSLPNVAAQLAADVSVTLDAQGRGRLTVDTAKLVGSGQFAVAMDIQAEDPNGQQVTTQAQVGIDPARTLAGIHVEEGLLHAGEPLAWQLIAVGLDGKLARSKAIEATLYREDRKEVRRVGLAGLLLPSETTVRVPVGTCRGVQGDKPVDCRLTPRKPGSYVLVATTSDDSGRRVQSKASFYVVEKSRKQERAVEALDPAKLPVLKADKTSYRLGETAHLTLRNRAPGAMALITWERDTIVHSEVREIPAAVSVLDIAIDGRATPNVHICVALFDRRRGIPEVDAPDTSGPTLAQGCETLQVTPEGQELKVTIEPQQTRYAPGAEAEVHVQVRDAAGQPVAGEVTLWAVDEGVLELSAYQLPAWTETLWQYVSRAMGIYASIEQLVRGRMSEQKGGDGGGGGVMAPRSHLRDVAFWGPSLQAGADGKAVARFKLPDNLTTYRLMAVATSGPRMTGTAESKFRIDKPLMLLSTWPHKVHSGDTFEAAMVVRNRSDAKLQGKVSLQLREVQGGAQLVGAPSQPFVLQPGEARELQFRVHTTRAGKIELVATAEAGKVQDGLVEAVEVVDPVVLQHVATFGSSSAGVREIVQKAIAARASAGGLQVSVSATALGQVLPAMSWLMEYPYECTEQLSSRLIAQLWQARLAKRFRLPAAAQPGPAIAATIDAVMSRRSADGRSGFAMWSSEDDAHPAATAWALRALILARDEGQPVDPAIVTASASWLRNCLHPPAEVTEPAPHLPPLPGLGVPSPQTPLTDDEQALLLTALAAAGTPDAAAVDALFAKRQSLAVSTRLFLAEAAQLDPATGGQKAQTILDELTRAMVVDERTAMLPAGDGGHSWSSEVRAQAQLLGLMLHAPQPHPLAGKVAEWLLDHRTDGRWSTTQENAWALQTLGRWLDRGTAGTATQTVSVLLAGQKAGELTLDPRQLGGNALFIGQDQLPSAATALELRRPAAGQLHYGLTYSWAPPAGSEYARNHGLFVRRTMVGRDGVAQPAACQRGQEFEVAVVVVTDRPRQDVVVTDQLPAGLEPVQFGRAQPTTAQLRALLALEDGRFDVTVDEDQAGLPLDEPPPHRIEYAGREVRWFIDELPAGVHLLRYTVRAAVRGEFLGRGVRAECMYRPEVWGSGDAYRVTIQ